MPWSASTIAFAASVSDCTVETEVYGQYLGYRFRPDDLPIQLAADGLSRAGYEPEVGWSGGAADANAFNAHGLACVNLANGMAEIHSPAEHIRVDDLEGMLEVTLAIVDAARDAADA